MRSQWIGLICLLLSGLLFAEETETKQFSGTVTGPEGPVADATVDLYLLTVDMGTMSYEIHPVAQVKSGSDGAFAFTVDAKPSQMAAYRIYCCIAQKEGLSCGWATLINPNQTVFNITLTEPQKMIGFIYDTDGTPVADAEVRLVVVALPGEGEQFMFGIEPVELFTTKTCDDGRFDFINLPRESSAEFLVRKSGKGTLLTLDESKDPSTGLTYKAGQTDISLTMQDGFKLAGTVIIRDGQKPAAGIPVLVMDTKFPVNLINEPQNTDENGSFVFGDLAPGDYRVSIQDDDWIAEPLTISIDEANVDDAVLELLKGGTLEIKVVDSATEEAVNSAQVSLRSEEGGQYQQISTDEEGIAKKQLLPGAYRVSVYAQGYRSSSQAGVVEIENDKTATLTVQLGGTAKITGQVLGPDGKPFEGADIRLIPSSGMQRDGVTTDDKGAFKIAWDPEDMSWAEGEFYLFASCPDENLAGVELIGPDAREATIKLQKGVELKGKVRNADGEPIVGARVYLNFRGSRYGTSFGRETKTDDQGQYCFKALVSEQRYSVNITNATGYGSGRQEVELVVSDTIRQADDIILKVADQKLSGQVVDVDDKPLANVRLHCYGEGQPNLNATTDQDGKFAFDNVCLGEITINANYQQGSEYMYANIRTEGGAEDVVVVLTPQGTSRYAPKDPPSLVGKPLPELSSCGMTIPADANSILIFAWDMNQRPSRYFIKQLTAKADLLSESNVTVILLNTMPIEKDKLDTWLAENRIDYPCGVMGDDAEEMKFKMGVKSLPWLILTDAEHNVVAEGFSVEELEGKLNR